MHNKKVFAHIVSFNNEKFIARCLDGILSQTEFKAGQNLHIRISDNNSQDSTREVINNHPQAKNVHLQLNKNNLGFSAAHNAGIHDFYNSDCDYYLCLNPDLFLTENALLAMTEALEKSDTTVGLVCPKLISADESLKPLTPIRIDAAGMFFTSSLRHFDIGSGDTDLLVYHEKSFVAGASGACILFKKEFLKDVVIETKSDPDLFSVYPELKENFGKRMQVFDEAFFAYREDADLSWRAQILGWKCLYEPVAVGHHVRVVRHDNREHLNPKLNMYGVRNRFLLQISNYHLYYGADVFINGFILRNLLVILGVFLRERSSLQAFLDLKKLFRRAKERRALIESRRRASVSDLRRIFTERYL